MTTMAKPTKSGLLNIVAMVAVAAAIVPGIVGQNYSFNQYNASYAGNLVLNVFIDESGKALVTGYADSIVGLPFLDSSQYKYDEDTKQLYALTNSLTYKSGNEWKATLPSLGTYSEYHSILYFPTSAKISKITSSKGLDYLVSASNDSFQVDLHGYDVLEPNVTIDYQLPLQESATSGGFNVGSIMPITSLMGLALASAALFIWIRKRGEKRLPQVDPPLEVFGRKSERIENPDLAASNEFVQISNGLQAREEDKSDEPGYDFVSDDGSAAQPDLLASELEDRPVEEDHNPFQQDDNLVDFGNDQAQTDYEQSEAREEGPSKDVHDQSAIKISSQMSAVMETLTAREKAVISALIDNDGKMNQADIRYETRIPKSSLTGILMSLERRKLIIKKEKGRTNAIELSEWFLSKRD